MRTADPRMMVSLIEAAKVAFDYMSGISGESRK